MSRPSVAVRIAGHDYKIRSDADPAALREIAGYVDKAMARVREQTGTVDSLDVAVLTCLNLARELLALHGRRVEAAVDSERLRGLIERVEAAIDPGKPEAEPGSVETAEVVEAPRTLELPNLDVLRDRATGPTGGGRDQAMDEDLAPARVAAAGRDRPS